MADNVKQTVIEEGTEFDGSIRSQCNITLSGKLKGQVSAPSLIVTPTGSVHGQVKVSKLKAQGEVAGELEADSVELSGRVNDQTVIRARTLEVMLTQSEGGLEVKFGNCKLEVGDRPAKTTQSQTKTSDASARKDDKNIVDTVAELMK